MDGSPLDAAFNLVKKADAAGLRGDFESSAKLHREASEKFSQAEKLTDNEEAQRTLRTLGRRHAERATLLNELKDKSALTGAKNYKTTGAGAVGVTATGVNPVQYDDLTSSLASARGISGGPTGGTNVPTAGAMSSPLGAKMKDDDPLNRLYNSFNASFVKMLGVERRERETGSASSIPSSILLHNGATVPGGTHGKDESFYLVPNQAAYSASSNTKNMTSSQLANENASLRQLLAKSNAQVQAYETAIRKQKDVLKSSVAQARLELNARDTLRNRQYEVEIDRLKTDNDKLKIQISRLKSRWDGLKESARKRREGSVEDDL